MQYIERIQQTIDFIEANLFVDLSLKELAEIAYFSDYHFHRVFHAYVGITAIEYIKKRRLSEAAAQLLTSQRKVVEIALGCGYNNHETFTRAFKRYFHISPFDFRLNNDDTLIYKKVRLNRLILSKNTGGVIVEPRMITMESFKWIGYQLKTTAIGNRSFNDIPHFIGEYYKNNLGEKIPNKINPTSRLNILTDFEKQRHGSFSYLIGYETDIQGKAAPANMIVRSFDKQQFAVFTTPKVPIEEFSSAIQSTWRFIFQEWFPQNNLEHAGTYEIEIYDERCSDKFAMEMDICIPIKSK
ncbi:AraC family transcriptional regulator [Paenibacillus mesophilus]|uniref:AraC family transcriptional regulator n=1 Tax=Paenibacillus mesophilus TaxID=2582849 RepID=UPI0013052604|nr:AraC family transcriptional regulator [Paenibacillus mesophilus]